MDCDGPLLVKYGTVRKLTVVRTYTAVFVSLTVKAVHLQPVSVITSAAFIAALEQ